MTTPTSQTWTLRLKSYRTTVLLHIDPLQSFSSIKTALHTALTETGISPNDHSATLPLPASPSEIKLLRPVDPLDATQGFALGEWEESEGDEEVAVDEEGSAGGNGNGKGKGKAKGKGKEDARDCPKGAGLKDGAVLAFWWERDGVQDREGMWGVQLASFEDAYGVQNEGDLGARGEFEG